ncbi:MAG: hypothetical protein WCP39_06095 [Chlamydiota bacterium]
MKRLTSVFGVVVLVSIIFLSGCASYNACALNNLTPVFVQKSTGNNTGISNDVVVIGKIFNKADCKKYLDRDVIAEGYQPIQLFIQNSSPKNYVFSLIRISIPCVRPEEVAEKVHTSTAGRATAYGLGALLFWPLAFPAIIDGLKSSDANKNLDNDFSSKTARDQVIGAHSYLNKLIFVPANEGLSNFTVTLMDQESGELKELQVVNQ